MAIVTRRGALVLPPLSDRSKSPSNKLAHGIVFLPRGETLPPLQLCPLRVAPHFARAGVAQPQATGAGTRAGLTTREKRRFPNVKRIISIMPRRTDQKEREKSERLDITPPIMRRCGTAEITPEKPLWRDIDKKTRTNPQRNKPPSMAIRQDGTFHQSIKFFQ